MHQIHFLPGFRPDPIRDLTSLPRFSNRLESEIAYPRYHFIRRRSPTLP